MRTLGFVLFGLLSPLAGAGAFETVVVFGDSLSDNGNTYARTFGFAPGGQPYWQGRFSNGPVWTEHLASALGAKTSNFAYGGGQAAPGQTDYGLVAIPNTGYDAGSDQGSQYDLFYGTLTGSEDFSDDLFLIGGGAVNYFSQGETTTAPAGDLVQLIVDLYELGARSFMVSNLPDLGKTPEGLDETEGPSAAELTAYSMAFNTELLAQLGTLQGDEAFNDISIYHLDLFGFMNDVIANPASYGFTDVTSAAIDVAGAPASASDPFWDDYLFFDGEHPTAQAHLQLGQSAFELVSVPEPGAAPLFAFAAALSTALTRRRPRIGTRSPRTVLIRRCAPLGKALPRTSCFAVALALGAGKLPVPAVGGEVTASALPDPGRAPAENGGARAGAGEEQGFLAELRRDGEAPVMNETLDLRECLVVTLEYNRKRPASQFQVEIARAMHRQALAGYFPHLTAQAGSNLRSDDISFVFPETEFLLPATTLSTPAMSVAMPNTTFTTGPMTFTVPRNSLGPGFPAADLQVPVGSQKIPVRGQTFDLPPQQFTVPEQTFTIPEQEVQVWDRVTHTALAEVKWLLLDGGWRRSLRKQARGGMAVAMSDARRTDLDIVYEVTKYYKGAVLARAAEREATLVIRRMETTLDLTKQLYEGGSLKVSRLDYTKGKAALDAFKVEFGKLVEMRKLADAALVHGMGLSWRSEIVPADEGLRFEPLGGELEQLVSDTYRYSPDWEKVQAGLDVYRARVDEQRSKMRPRLAFFGNAQTVHNDLDSGFANDSNLNSWNVGLGVEVPLYRGGLERARVREAKARLAELEERQAQVREKIAWGVKSLYERIGAIEEQRAAAGEAEASARENRELHDDAYMNDLAEAEDVFDAQIDEAKAIVVRLRTEFAHAEARAKLDAVVGYDVMNLLGVEPYTAAK